MSKQEFLDKLRENLCGLPEEEIEERISFYSEMIDDRMEDGLTEEDAISDIGSIEKITEQIIADIPLAKIAKEKIKPKRKIKAWEIILLVLGSPIWLSLGAAAVSVILSLYAVVWSVIISLWAVFAAGVACTVYGIFGGAVFAVTNGVLAGLAFVGIGIFGAGLSVFLFFGCLFATKGVVLLTKKVILGIKRCFVKKEVE